jgi:Holliday junction resolvase RusA-like endonuclease
MKGYENVPSDWSPAEIRYTEDGQRHQTLRFIVAGQPIQQGNIIGNRYGNLYDKTKGLRPWRDMVSWAAKAAMAGGYRRRTGDMKIVGPPHRADEKMIVDTFSTAFRLEKFTGPVLLDVTFIRRRPKGMPKKSTPPHIKYPDLSKFVRAVEDSMTGIVYNDDAQIVTTYSHKRYAEFGESPGAIITVTDVK